MLNINIPAPAEQHTTVHIEPGQGVTFNFDLSTARFERADGNLTLALENGSELVLEGFFVPGAEGQLPELELMDGAVVDAVDYLAEMNPELDLTPASGAAPSGGVNAYNDDAGSLVGGLEGSGSLEGIQWSSGLAGGTEVIASAAVAGASSGAPTNTEKDAPPYTARAVFYDTQNQGQGGSFNFRVPADGSVEVESKYGFIDAGSLRVVTDADGNLIYSLDLSAEGRAAMAEALAAANGDASGVANVYDYITITINGQSYVMQVVLNQNGQYSAAAEDALNRPDTESGSILGEWHTEHNATTGAGRVSSEGGDEIWLNNGMFGNNDVNAGNGDNTVHLGSSMYADGNDNSLESGSGQDKFDINGHVWATNGSKNIIDTGAGDDKLAVGGWLLATGGGSNDIKLGDGNDSMSVSAQVKAEAGSSNSINLGEGDNSLSIENGSLWAVGGHNTVTGGDGNDTVNMSYELSASQAGLNEIRTAGGDDNVKVGSIMRADGGDNIIDTGAGNDDVTVGSWMYAINGGHNKVDLGAGDDNMTVNQHVQSRAGSSNNIDLGSGNNSLTIEGSNLWAYGGHNTVTSADGNNVVNIGAEMSASFGGTNEILLGTGDDSVTVSSMMRADGGDNIIDTGAGADEISVNGFMYATNGGSNTVNADEGSIIVNGSVYAWEEHGTATSSFNSLTAGWNIRVDNSGSSSNNLTAVQALRHDAQNSLTAQGEMLINASNSKGGATGVYGEGDTSSNIISAGESVNVYVYSNTGDNSSNTTHEAMGMWANQGSKLEVTAQNGNIAVIAAGVGKSSATALSGNHSTVLSAQNGSVNLHAAGARGAAGIHGSADINAGYGVSVVASASQGGAVGINSLGYSDVDIDVKAGGGTVSINADASGELAGGSSYHMRDAYAIKTSNTSSTTIDADIINVGAIVSGQDSDFNAYAMYTDGYAATDATKTVLSGDYVEMYGITYGSGNAYGMYATVTGTSVGKETANIIQAASNDHPIVVSIVTEVGSSGDAVAMFASGKGAINHIKGSDLGDTISIHGNIHAESGGVNLIDAGNGDNVVDITGDISGSLNRIVTGSGDDTITLDGAVARGSLTLITGGGHDVLILAAGSIEEFNSNYQDWLENVSSGNFSGVESINVMINSDNLDLAALEWLTDAFSGVEVVFDGKGGMDILNVDGFGDGHLNLSELADLTDGFEVVDLRGGNDNVLNIDSLLNGMKIDGGLDSSLIGENDMGDGIKQLLNGSVLRVNGDEGDSVTLGDGWSGNSAGSVVYDNISYDVYTNDQQDGQYLLIQAGLVA